MKRTAITIGALIAVYFGLAAVKKWWDTPTKQELEFDSRHRRSFGQ